MGDTSTLSISRGASRRPSRTHAAGGRPLPAKFLRFFPDGFRDQAYLDLERGYKWQAHQQWNEMLDRPIYRALLRQGRFADIAGSAVRIESRTNLLFSFEKMALRDAIRSPTGARLFADGLYDFLHGAGDPGRRFDRWCQAIAELPRRQTRVLTWPLVTVFGFIAQPDVHIFLKPNVTRIAARQYGVDFHYESHPAWPAYESLLAFADRVRRDLRDLKPRNMIDIQSFLWVQGSDEYEE